MSRREIKRAIRCSHAGHAYQGPYAAARIKRAQENQLRLAADKILRDAEKQARADALEASLRATADSPIVEPMGEYVELKSDGSNWLNPPPWLSQVRHGADTKSPRPKVRPPSLQG